MAIHTASDESGILVMPSGKAGRATSHQRTEVRGPGTRLPTDMMLKRRIPRWLPWAALGTLIVGGAVAGYLLFWPGGVQVEPPPSGAAMAGVAGDDDGRDDARVATLEAELATARAALAVKEDEAAEAAKARDALKAKAAAAGELEKQLAELVGASGDEHNT